jgi:metallo-beta-lactamase class B
MRSSMSLIGALLAAASPSLPVDDPLLRPISPDAAREWLVPQPPARIFGNTYLVGFGGLNVGLIKTSAGLILIDGGVPQGVRTVEANIRKLGFSVSDIRLILSTEPHFDHASGFAALERDTGATVVASAEAATVLRAGKSGPDDPQMAWLPAYPPVSRVRIVHDEEQLRVGDVTITAHATPGHTPGSMSWTWRSCETSRCANIVFASSLRPLEAGRYRFSDPSHQLALATYRRTFDVVRSLPCDILLTPHPGQSDGDVKFAKLLSKASPNPFLDPAACRTYADANEKDLSELLQKDAAASPSSTTTSIAPLR